MRWGNLAILTLNRALFLDIWKIQHELWWKVAMLIDSCYPCVLGLSITITRYRWDHISIDWAPLGCHPRSLHQHPLMAQPVAFIAQQGYRVWLLCSPGLMLQGEYHWLYLHTVIISTISSQDSCYKEDPIKEWQSSLTRRSCFSSILYNVKGGYGCFVILQHSYNIPWHQCGIQTNWTV